MCPEGPRGYLGRANRRGQLHLCLHSASVSQIRENEKEKLAFTLPGQGHNIAASCRGHLVFKVRWWLELERYAESGLSQQ